MSEDLDAKDKTLPNEDTSSFLKALPWLLVGLGFALSAVFFLVKSCHGGTASITTELSNFGQYVSGTTGVVFSLASVLLFFLSLRIQRKELELQRVELRRTTETLEAQRVEMEKQNVNQAVSQLDSQFFNMLAFLLDLKASYKIGNKDGHQHFAEQLAGINSRWSKNPHRDDTLANQLIREISEDFRNFFTHLCTISEIVSQSSILTEQQRNQYFKILNGALRKEEKDAISIAIMARSEFTDRELGLFEHIEAIRKYE